MGLKEVGLCDLANFFHLTVFIVGLFFVTGGPFGFDWAVCGTMMTWKSSTVLEGDGKVSVVCSRPLA